ncbi:MAG TPA: cyclic pyranopterin monophosphate synthase MoaC [Kiritimatiellia bacterium]|nr:cyclic pyranopterin monophosphate synthase MoaC [Kiritimatiellia bacterium]HMP32940.1 cyclic pyranopterin monophosphate synthase MoaC [Kiritimatiellia bacterium]
MPRKPSPTPPRRLTHIGPGNLPSMVDIGEKPVTRRTAEAEAVMLVPAAVTRLFRDGEVHGPKGPVFQTAIIAGTQAVKETSRLIPFCHPLPIDRCTVTITRTGRRFVVRCLVSALYKTGVEMEALTGASVAALTIYDMLKAVSTDMEITGIHVVRKTGGKTDIGSP